VLSNKTQHDSDAGLIRVTAPARLHLGFLGLDGADQGRFGSIGVGITGFSTTLVASRSAHVVVQGDDTGHVAGVTQALLDHYRIDTGLKVRVEHSIPRHQGLGSGTQLALALGTAISALYGLNASVEDLAIATGRGRRSGVGLGVFRHGGFIVDSGRSPGQALPTTVLRHDFPAPWRLVLVLDPQARGLSGATERKAFKTLPELPTEVGAALCQQVLMQLLPALLEQDCDRFGAAVSAMQARLGACFSAAQGGVYASDKVRQALEFLAQRYATGIGQTSWGPTGFAIFPDHDRARQAVEALAREGVEVKLVSVGAQNNGASKAPLTGASKHRRF